MVLSIIIAINAAPGLLGTQEAIRQSQSKEKREEHRGRRCHLLARCVKASSRSQEIDGRRIVLANRKLYIEPESDSLLGPSHPFAGYYLPYPDEDYEGLVSTITDEAPILNWIYVDRETFEIKYGVRAEVQPHLHGPWDCTRQDRRLTFQSWEGFCVVEDMPGLWSLYFDHNDDGLQEKARQSLRVLEIELSRVEKRWKKDPAVRRLEQGTICPGQPGVEVADIRDGQSQVTRDQQLVLGPKITAPEEIALPLSPKFDTGF